MTLRTLTRAFAPAVLALGIATFVPAAAFAGPSVFKAGFAERDMSPAIGMEQPGGYGKAYHTVFHDPCKARAAVFDDGTTRVAVVGVDAISIGKTTVQAARAAIHKRCGIDPGSVLVGASHTHSGGPIGGPSADEFADAEPLVRSLVTEHSINTNPEYARKVENAIVEAVCAADAARAVARGGAGYGVEDKVAFNRRFRMKDGFTMTHPGQGNPAIVEPAGPTDPQVGVVGCWDEKGKLLGCLVNFACHCTTGPGGISADYVYYLERAVRGVFGEHAVVVFLAGTAGDVTQVDNRCPFQIKQFGEVSARFVGGRVGAEAVKTLLAMEPSAGPLTPLAVRQKTLEIPRRPPSPSHVAQARELVAQDPKKSDPTAWTFAKETVLLAEKVKRAPVVNVEIQAIQLGPVALLASPAEYFCEYGLQLKAHSGFPVTFPISLANDEIGYVPTEEAFSSRGGGYETRLTSYSNLEPTAGRQIAEALLKLAATFKPGAVPKAPALPPFHGQPWSYGNLPPQLD